MESDSWENFFLKNENSKLSAVDNFFEKMEERTRKSNLFKSFKVNLGERSSCNEWCFVKFLAFLALQPHRLFNCK